MQETKGKGKETKVKHKAKDKSEASENKYRQYRMAVFTNETQGYTDKGLEKSM